METDEIFAILPREDTRVGGVLCLQKHIFLPGIPSREVTIELSKTFVPIARLQNVFFKVTTICRVGVVEPGSSDASRIFQIVLLRRLLSEACKGLAILLREDQKMHKNNKSWRNR